MIISLIFLKKDYLFSFRLYYNDGKPLNKLSLFGKTINISDKTKPFYNLIQNPKNKEFKFELIEIAKKYFMNDTNITESESEKGDKTGFSENKEFTIL